MNVLPGQGAAQQERDLQGLQVPLADPFVAAYRRGLVTGVPNSVHVQRIDVAARAHRNGCGEPDGIHSRDLSQATRDQLVGRCNLRRVRDLARRNPETQRQHSLGVGEPGVDATQRQEAAHHQPRGDQQYQGQGHLAHRQHGLCSMPLPSARSGTTAFLQRIHQPRADLSQHREHAEDGSRSQRHDQREEQNATVHGDLIQARKVVGSSRGERVQSDIGQSQATEPSQHAQHEALFQVLPTDPATVGTHGAANGHLGFLAVRSDQEQVRHVGAGDEQHDPHPGHENPEQVRHVTHKPFLQRLDVRSEARPFGEVRHRAARELLEGERQQASGVRAGLVQSDAIA